MLSREGLRTFILMERWWFDGCFVEGLRPFILEIFTIGNHWVLNSWELVERIYVFLFFEINTFIGDSVPLAWISRRPPPALRNRFIEYLTVNLIHLFAKMYFLPPCWSRFNIPYFFLKGLIFQLGLHRRPFLLNFTLELNLILIGNQRVKMDFVR